MITHEDQMRLFTIIAEKINYDVISYAFGGTAMMFYGYKGDTKDIDLLFETEKERIEFIRAIELLGFKETSAIKIYIPEKLMDKYKPLMFKRDDNTRFDLFVKKIFKTEISEKMKEDKYAMHQFKRKHTLTINALRTEHIVMLKSVTERDKDFEDILTILKKDKYFNWQYLIDEAIWQYQHGDSWVIYDLEETIKELQKYIFIEQKYLQQLYDTVKTNIKKVIKN